MSSDKNNSHTCTERPSKLRVVTQIIVDVVLWITVGIPVLVSYRGGFPPFRRGFFCNDDSLKHPYIDDTVSDSVLIGVGFTVAFILIILVEIPRALHSKEPLLHTREFLILLKSSCVFVFGFTITMAFVQALKYSLGELRPHFMEVCKPKFSPFDCKHGFITNYTCTDTEYSDSILRRSRTSFPSGHAAFSMYHATFLSLYIQTRCFVWFSRTLRPLLQAGLFMLSVLCSITRVQDHKHHPRDVIAGSVLGIVVAVFIFKSLGEKAFRSRQINIVIPFGKKSDTSSEPRTPTPLLQRNESSLLNIDCQRCTCNGNLQFTKSLVKDKEFSGKDSFSNINVV